MFSLKPELFLLPLYLRCFKIKEWCHGYPFLFLLFHLFLILFKVDVFPITFSIKESLQPNMFWTSISCFSGTKLYPYFWHGSLLPTYLPISSLNLRPYLPLLHPLILVYMGKQEDQSNGQIALDLGFWPLRLKPFQTHPVPSKNPKLTTFCLELPIL